MFKSAKKTPFEFAVCTCTCCQTASKVDIKTGTVDKFESFSKGHLPPLPPRLDLPEGLCCKNQDHVTRFRRAQRIAAFIPVFRRYKQMVVIRLCRIRKTKASPVVTTGN